MSDEKECLRDSNWLELTPAFSEQILMFVHRGDVNLGETVPCVHRCSQIQSLGKIDHYAALAPHFRIKKPVLRDCGLQCGFSVEKRKNVFEILQPLLSTCHYLQP